MRTRHRYLCGNQTLTQNIQPPGMQELYGQCFVCGLCECVCVSGMCVRSGRLVYVQESLQRVGAHLKHRTEHPQS